MSQFFDLLYAKPSFWSGVARILDFGGALNQYNTSRTPNEADLTALRSDWEAISEDLQTAASVVEADVMRSAQSGPTQ